MSRYMEKGTGTKPIIIIILLLFVIVIISCAILYFNKQKEEGIDNQVSDVEKEPQLQGKKEIISKEEAENKIPTVKIFTGNDRPIAFMIDNNKNAQPQASLNSTYMVYEIIVEGGESRLMALFKGTVAEDVGPIRSARHYFLDYALENDAIYAHLGNSPQAQRDFKLLDIDNINGQVYDTGKAKTSTSLYWRVNHKKAPHNAYTNTESILKICKDKGYRTTSDKESVLNYVTSEVDLAENNTEVLDANYVKIPYATGHNVEYKYNEETQRYTRYSKNKKMTDEVTKEDITTKNIIITLARNYTLNDGENKGRQDVVTVGELDGYYITNGKAIKIKCSKKSRKDQTTYLDMEGKEINVNDGNTWVNICPIEAKITFGE